MVLPPALPGVPLGMAEMMWRIPAIFVVDVLALVGIYEAGKAGSALAAGVIALVMIGAVVAMVRDL